jgi:hypothetical protein
VVFILAIAIRPSHNDDLAANTIGWQSSMSEQGFRQQFIRTLGELHLAKIALRKLAAQIGREQQFEQWWRVKLIDCEGNAVGAGEGSIEIHLATCPQAEVVKAKVLDCQRVKNALSNLWQVLLQTRPHDLAGLPPEEEWLV